MPALEAGDDILTSHLLAVVEGDILAQCERDALAIIGALVVFDEDRLDLAFGIKGDQRLRESPGDNPSGMRRRRIRRPPLRLR